MICKACGAVVPDNSLYCPQCGTPLDKVNTEVKHGNGANTQNTAPNMSDKERQEMQYFQEKLNKGRLYGIVSIVCSILGLGSFGSLDIVAVICGYLGLKHLKAVPDHYPEKSTAVTLNRAGIICSIGFILAVAIFVIIALLAFPWIFASIAALFGL